MSPSDLSYLAMQHISSSHLQLELKDCSHMIARRCPATLHGFAFGSSLFLMDWVTAFAPTAHRASSQLSLFSQGCL